MSYSENEDDPAVYESSGDEWDESMEIEKKRNNRRSSTRLSKKPRITHVVESTSDSDYEDDDDDDSDDEEVIHKSNGVRKTKKSPTKPIVNKSVTNDSPTTPKPINTNASSQNHNFSTGTFVVLKKDAQEGSPTNPPCIWKIDGKALLQKYEPFEEDGKVKHRNTSIYTGWSSLDKDQYSSIQVQVFIHSGQKMIVEVNWDQLKTIQIDSD